MNLGLKTLLLFSLQNYTDKGMLGVNGFLSIPLCKKELMHPLCESTIINLVDTLEWTNPYPITPLPKS